MILSIILLTAGALGIGYALYKAKGENGVDNTQELQHDWYIHEQQPEISEGEAGDLLNQLVEHMDAYAQYYDQKTWENHNCRQVTQRCMDMEAGSEERLALYEVMKHDVTQLNRYVNSVKSFSQNELEQSWEIALQLKDIKLNNPEQAALFDKCWEELVPYVITEGYFHPTLSNNLEYRTELIEQTRLKLIQTKQEYAQTHRQMLQWEHEYNHIKGETIMADAELETAKLAMEAADHALAIMLAENADLGEQALANAYAHAAEQALILKQAEDNVAAVDMARMALETAKIDMEEANIEQVFIDHHQPGDELHPNLPQGARIVPNNDVPAPPIGGGWWSEFIQWIWSWFG